MNCEHFAGSTQLNQVFRELLQIHLWISFAEIASLISYLFECFTANSISYYLIFAFANETIHF